jgi:hypothetical protein
MPNVENDVAIDTVSIWERLFHLDEAGPARYLYDLVPGGNLIRGIWIYFGSVFQMLQRNHVHRIIFFSK